MANLALEGGLINLRRKVMDLEERNEELASLLALSQTEADMHLKKVTEAFQSREKKLSTENSFMVSVRGLCWLRTRSEV
jgi:hypothetical protein